MEQVLYGSATTTEAVVSVVGAQAVRQIEALARAGDIPEFSRYVAHAALDCAYGSLSGGRCGPSAVGALAGEDPALLGLTPLTTGC